MNESQVTQLQRWVLLLSIIWCRFIVPFCHGSEGVTADVLGAYSWGEYFHAKETNLYNGMSIHTFLGYRLPWQIEVGPAVNFSFPQVGLNKNDSNSALSQQALGGSIGYLWKQKIGLFIEYFPLSSLEETSQQEIGPNTQAKSYRYTGNAFGAGAKYYLTASEDGAVKLGLKFNFLREYYLQSTATTELTGHAVRTNAVVSLGGSTETRNVNVIGNTFEMGIFIGI